jgi:YVTN family beta-propeller protein
MKKSIFPLIAMATLTMLFAVLALMPVRGLAQKESAPSYDTGAPAFMSPHAAPIALLGGHVFVANTPSGTVDVLDTKTQTIIKRVTVGIDPVSIAARPDGKEVWVANHVSDSVSVIDTDANSPTYLEVVATVQDIDLDTKATRFDEPVGIAFASNTKAYVALSSENKIAVVNVATRQVDKTLAIHAQDPRAIVVRGDRLYVIPFESGNQTQLSGGVGKLDGNLATFDAVEHSLTHNNVLSIGAVVDVVKHPKVPDRDLYIFDTKTDTLVETVNTLGTLLYGLTVDSQGRVYIAQTDARNDINGKAGTKKHSLVELENRPFLNRITCVDAKEASKNARKPMFIDLEPLPPSQPALGAALATPFAIQVTDDDSTLVASAAGSDKLFTVDARTGKVLGHADVGAVPEGIALESARDGKPARAWVLNAAANTVSVVELSDLAKPKATATIPLQDPTNPVMKRGRIAFSTATASSTGTFSCESCHPNGHTDQLLWVLKTPIVTGGNQIMPRSTMPLRGLRDTAPYHWDGVPGDPYGGINSASVNTDVASNSDPKKPESSVRFVVDGSLASTMALATDKTINDEGKGGRLTKAERDDMSQFLLNISFPPAPKRPYTNVLSTNAQRGFQLFHEEGDLDPSKGINVCGNCHRMPFLVSTNTPGTGMDAPTWRGAYDRWLILPQGRLNIIDFDFYRAIAEQGAPEKSVWQMSWGGRPRFNPVWDMVLEESTGFSGAFARQTTLNQTSAKSAVTTDLLDALELSASEESVALQAEGVLINGKKATHVTLQFHEGKYVTQAGERRSFTRAELVSLASQGKFIGTFTAWLGSSNAEKQQPQPALWTLGPIEQQRGRQPFPVLFKNNATMTLSGRHLQKSAHVFIDGRRTEASLTVNNSSDEMVTIALSKLPPVGTHFLQVQNPRGLMSNDFIFHVTDNLNAKPVGSESTLLSDAVGRNDITAVKLLLQNGAKVDEPNNDGNTPLHIAAFFCRFDIVELLLEKGASVSAKSKRGETPIDVVSGAWSKGLADFYTILGSGSDLKRLEQDRPKMAKRLREHTKI